MHEIPVWFITYLFTHIKAPVSFSIDGGVQILLMSIGSPLGVSAGTSIGVSVNDTIETSISASRSTFLTRSPADPMLDSNDDMSVSRTSVSREVLLLDQVDAMDANTEWAKNVMFITIMGCIMDLTHWQMYPQVGFWRPASARHWSVMSTLSTWTLPRDMWV